jgi:hypothetical protein
MPSPSETAHVQWLFKEKERIAGLRRRIPERRKKLIEEDKRYATIEKEINKMIALYGVVSVDEDTAMVAEITGKVPCPQQGCGKAYSTPALVGAHMRKEHNVYGGLSGRAWPEENRGGPSRRSGKGRKAA